MRNRTHALLFCSFLLAGGCSVKDPQASTEFQVDPKGEVSQPENTSKRAQTTIEKIAAEHLPNPVRVHPRVISGGLPEGDDAFAELKSLGVKTVVSVDGAKPDVATAKKYGLRYVHLPHGYDGIPEKRAEELAKVVRDLPGVVYIHCHHGKHRSPAASAVACVGAGLIGKQDALNVLRIAGTSENYRGLFESAHSAQQFDRALLDKLEAEFPSTAKLPAMAEAMVAVEHTFDHLKALDTAKWKSLPNHPDLIPEHEALLLREHFTELLRVDEVKRQPAEFQQLMMLAEEHAQELEDALRKWSAMNTESEVSAAVSAAFKKVADNCKECHVEFRDVPLSEKVSR